MKLKIKKIQLSELEAFVKSEQFNNLETIPVSTNRVLSYLKNPHAKPDDTVLYLGYIGEKPVAFRTLFADVVYAKAQAVRFGWCSGNWVHPNYRRQGFSEQLLKEAYNDWDQKLMFTNYAPNSENLYIKTGWFNAIQTFEGARAYLFPKTRKLFTVGNKQAFKQTFYTLFDFGISLLSHFRLLFYKAPKQGVFRFECLEIPDAECYRYLEKNTPDHVFRRYEKELKWIFAFPWITHSEVHKQAKYPFSWVSEDFKYQTVKIFQEHSLKGFCLFSVREKHLKTLYFSGANEVIPELAVFLTNYTVHNKIEIITIYKKELADQFLERKFPFLWVKKYGQKIYSTFKLPESEKAVFQDGDGDVIFT